mmetsp:Transcript_10628/g.21399  ORF Transcript_10628/g.21399 Transcript_10628/m.21399 type:complete len:263 (-) Transcript_10628:14-802(-)
MFFEKLYLVRLQSGCRNFVGMWTGDGNSKGCCGVALNPPLHGGLLVSVLVADLVVIGVLAVAKLASSNTIVVVVVAVAVAAIIAITIPYWVVMVVQLRVAPLLVESREFHCRCGKAHPHVSSTHLTVVNKDQRCFGSIAAPFSNVFVVVVVVVTVHVTVTVDVNIVSIVDLSLFYIPSFAVITSISTGISTGTYRSTSTIPAFRQHRFLSDESVFVVHGRRPAADLCLCLNVFVFVFVLHRCLAGRQPRPVFCVRNQQHEHH